MKRKVGLLWFLLFGVSVFSGSCDPVQDDTATRDGSAPSEAGVGSAVQALVAPTTTTLNAVGDTDLVQFTPTVNSGTSNSLRVTGASLTSWQAGLVKFDPAAIRSAVGTGTLQSATLQLTVSSVSLGWGNSQVSVSRMTMPWTETGATWLCGNDTDNSLLGKFINNCATQDRWGIEWWSLSPRPFAGTPTATINVPFGQQGVVSADVTADIQAVAAGGAHQGWILTSTADLSTVWIQFSSRESSAVPKLVLKVAPSCTVVGTDTTCNGIDDDCDGRIDEAYVATGSTCGVGACARTGTKTCVSGAIHDSCAPGTPAASDTTCDGVDNNCNGTVDEGYTSQSSTCGTGACARTGMIACVNGSVQNSCLPGTPAANDLTCNSVDDNCNGAVDEGYVVQNTMCGVGVCARTGITSCVGGAVQNSCVPGAPGASDATCDGIDDDCSGTADEDFGPQTTTCAVNGCSAHGTTACIGGQVVDSCSTAPTCFAELNCTDGVDNDADSQTDCSDPDCAGAPSCSAPLEICGNSLDDDADGLPDCADPDCHADPSCSDVAPDPEDVAPPITPSMPATFAGSIDFLYNSADPIQREVVPGSIQPRLVSLVRGSVRNRAGQGLAGVRVSVLGHPEFGFTNTTAGGDYVIAVNGGSTVRLNFKRSGLLPAQRQVSVPWNDAAHAEDLVLVPSDTAVTSVDFSATSVPQVARGSVSTDLNGSRQATVYVPPMTGAALEMPNGSMVSVPTLHMRLTETTVGEAGPSAMLADLPPTTAYTYAVELSSDESEEAGAKSIQFSQPLAFYLENFIDMPVGSLVPAGYFDRQRGVWIPMPNGRVIKVLSVTSGVATVDVSGSGQAATVSELTALGITGSELARLGQLYAANQTLWRVQTSHFTYVDLNWPSSSVKFPSPPDDRGGIYGGPDSADPDDPNRPSKGPCAKGSRINCFDRSLGEDIPIIGTPYNLHYESKQSSSDGSLEVDLESNRPALLSVTLDIGGRDVKGVHETYPPGAPKVRFAWDGRDYYGRPVTGSRELTIRVCHTYQNEPYPALMPGNEFANAYDAFDRILGERLAAGLYRELDFQYQTATTCREWKQWIVSSPDPLGSRTIGGWTFDAQHLFDPMMGVIQKGDGTVQNRVSQASYYVGSGNRTGLLSTAEQNARANGANYQDPNNIWLGQILAMDAAPDGTVYVLEGAGASSNVWQFTPGLGARIVFATTNSIGFNGSVPPALRFPASGSDGCFYGQGATDVAVGPDGTVYVELTAFGDSTSIWRLDPARNMPTRVAGIGTDCRQALQGTYADQVPATDAFIQTPQEPTPQTEDTTTPSGVSNGLAVGPDGSVYLADRGMVRRIGPDGIITTILGNGPVTSAIDNPIGVDSWGSPSASGLLGTSFSFAQINDIAVDQKGLLYVAVPEARGGTANHVRGSVYVMEPSGRVSLFAGSKNDGVVTTPPLGQAVGASFTAHRLKTTLDGRVLILASRTNGFLGFGDPREARLFSVRNSKIVQVADRYPIGAGGRPFPVPRDVSAMASMVIVTDIAPLGDGSTLFMDVNSGRVFRLEPTVAEGISLVASEDGSEVYEFAVNGQHTRTLDPLTGAVRRSFTYDAMGRLEAIDDGAGNTTHIVRDGTGRPQYIDAPFGQRTELTYDSTNHLAAVTNTIGAHEMTYHAGTQTLATFKKPTGAESSFLYNEQSVLTKDTDPAGGAKELIASGRPGDFSVSVKTAEGRTTSYHDLRSITGLTRTTTAPDQTVTTESIDDNDRTVTTSPDGTIVTKEFAPDPRWGRTAPLMSRLSIKTPSGLDHVITATRSATLTAPTDPFAVQQLVSTSVDNGDTWTSTYAGATRTTTFVSPLGRSRSSTVDARGRVTQTAINGLAPIQMAYDARSRLQSISRASGGEVRTTTFTYRPEDGFVGTVTGPVDGQTWTIGRDQAGRATSVTDPVGAQFGFTFNGVDALASLTPPGRAPWTLTHTPIDLLRTVVAPPLVDGQAGSLLQFDYSPDQNLKLVTNPDTRTVGYDYHPTFGRLTHSASADASWDYAYATNGTLSSVTRADASGMHTLGFTQDGLLPVRQTWGGSSGAVSGAVERVYDKYFRATTLRIVNANSVSLSYDKDGLLTTAGDLTLTRNPQNGVVTSTTQGQLSTTHTIDGFGEPDVYTLKRGTTVLFVEDIGTHDKAGRILDRSEQALNGATLDTKSYGYSYDLAGHLAHVTVNGAQVSEYAYDGNGNRQRRITPAGTIIGRYDAEDRVSRYCPETAAGDPNPDPLSGLPCNSYTYRASGELATKTEIGTGRVTQYEYDEGRSLRRVTLPDGRVIDYELDPMGRRIGKKVGGVRQWGLLYQGSTAPAAQLDAANNLVAQFIYASKSNVPEYMLRAPQPGFQLTSYRLVTDHLGSVRLVVRTSDGSIAQRMEYDEFGNVIVDTNPGFQPFGFAGGLYDADTGLVRFGARDYDAVTGRWTARDPLLFGGGQANLYEYVGGDPVNFIDPTGRYTTVTIWDPVGYGESSFGHVSVDVNGTAYSFGPGGMHIEPAMYYEQRNEQFRGGTVYDLDLGPELEEALDRYLGSPQGDYSVLQNNCGDPIERFVRRAVGSREEDKLTPAAIGGLLKRSGLVDGSWRVESWNP